MSDLSNLSAMLNDPAGRRFAAEFVVVALVIAAVTTVGIDALGSAFSGLFPAGFDGYARYEFPDTRLEGLHALVGTLLLGVYLWVRLFLTELGEKLRTLAEEEMV